MIGVKAAEGVMHRRQAKGPTCSKSVAGPIQRRVTASQGLPLGRQGCPPALSDHYPLRDTSPRPRPPFAPSTRPEP